MIRCLIFVALIAASIEPVAAMNPLIYVGDDECGSGGCGGGAINGLFALLLLLAFGLAVGVNVFVRSLVAYISFIGLLTLPILTIAFFSQGRDDNGWKCLIAGVICYILLKWAMHDKPQIESTKADVAAPIRKKIVTSTPGESPRAGSSFQTAARGGSHYRNQFCDPMNVASCRLMLDSVPEYPGFAVMTGDGKNRHVVVYGANVRLVVRGFVEWAINGTRSDWDDFLSYGFSPVKLALVNSRPENFGREYELAQAESARISKGGRSRVFDGSIFLTTPYLAASSHDRTSAHTTKRESTSKLAANVGQKNIEVVADLLNLSRSQVGDHPSSSVSLNSSDGVHKQPILLSVPIRGYVPASRCGLPGSLLTDQYVWDFGADLMYFLEYQCHRIHWQIDGNALKAVDLQKALNADFSFEKDNFGVDLVDATFMTARQFLNDLEIGFPQPFQAVPEIAQDIENFGEDLVDMATKVITHVMTENLGSNTFLPQPTAGVEEVAKALSAEAEAEILALKVGAKVIHRIKGADFGTGIIREMNGQYLTVNFPDSGKEFQLLTATADSFLMLVSKSVDLAERGPDRV